MLCWRSVVRYLERSNLSRCRRDRVSSKTSGMDGVGELARAAAFRLLLETGRPVSAEQIADEIKAAPTTVETVLRQLAAAGRIRVSAEGYVVGSAGLSVVPAAHELWLGPRRFWTWCA